MQCIICYEKKWILETECNHHICISCLFSLKKMNVHIVEKNYSIHSQKILKVY